MKWRDLLEQNKARTKQEQNKNMKIEKHRKEAKVKVENIKWM